MKDGSAIPPMASTGKQLTWGRSAASAARRVGHRVLESVAASRAQSDIAASRTIAWPTTDLSYPHPTRGHGHAALDFHRRLRCARRVFSSRTANTEASPSSSPQNISGTCVGGGHDPSTDQVSFRLCASCNRHQANSPAPSKPICSTKRAKTPPRRERCQKVLLSRCLPSGELTTTRH